MTLTGVNEQCKVEWQYASSKKAVIAKSVCIKAAFQTYKSVQIKMKPFSFIKSTFCVIFHSMNKFLNESQDWMEKRLNKCRVWTLLICQHLHNNLSVKTVILSWNISFCCCCWSCFTFWQWWLWVSSTNTSVSEFLPKITFSKYAFLIMIAPLTLYKFYMCYSSVT